MRIFLSLMIVIFLSTHSYAAISTTTTFVDRAFVGSDALCFIDLDRDGDMDIVGAADNADATAADISWWENDGSQSFTEHSIVTDFANANSIFAIDLDIDGDIDIISTAAGATDDVVWWENDSTPSDGGWIQRTITDNFDGANSVAACDIDFDGDIDIISTAGTADDITWWESDGTPSDGGWIERAVDDNFDGVNSIFLIDLDFDGDIDVLSAADVDNDVAWWENDGNPSDGGWTKRTIDDNFGGANSVLAFDIDNDGDLDVFSTAGGDNDIAYWESDGTPVDGGWIKRTVDDNFVGANSVCILDLDFDGDHDLIATALDGDDLAWWENDSTPVDGGWVKHAINEDYNGASSASSCDLDGDGDLDILASANIAGDVAWWANDANLVSGNIGFSNKYSVSDSYDGVIFVGSIDLDRDGDYDILGNGRLADDVTWWESDSTPSDGGWTIHAIDSSFDGSYAAAFADLDIDGDIDVVAAAYNADEIAWYENNGSETFTKRSVATDFNGANSVFIIDLDGDGDLDIAATAGIDDDLTWWANDSTPSDGGWTMSTIDGDLNGANSVFCVDVDKDGDIDILATADVGDDVAWWENNGSESFTKRKIEDSFNGAASISAVDLDADGDMDVLACASNSNKLTWWASDGTPADGGWTEYTIDENVTDASILHPVDLDRDGDTDILAAEKSGDEVLWMENDGTPLDGGWIKHRIDTGFDGASSLFPIDLDRDGDIDLLGAAGEGDDITWWENGGASAAGASVATEAGATANINVDFTTLTAPSHQMSLGQSAESNVGDTTTEEAEQEIDVRCFIATAAFGTPQSYEVMRLRRFRDRYLAATPAGRGIIKAYYTVSPPVADIISKNWVLKNLVRFILKSILCIIN